MARVDLHRNKELKKALAEENLALARLECVGYTKVSCHLIFGVLTSLQTN